MSSKNIIKQTTPDVCPDCKGDGIAHVTWDIVPNAKVCSRCKGTGLYNKRELLKYIKLGVRLKTKAPKVEIPKNVYNRKVKHIKDVVAEE